MKRELDLEEKRKEALPGDWLQDFNFVGGFQLHTCAKCLHPFHSFPYRELCWLCKEVSTCSEK